jgi:hypothetical protein
MRAVQKRALTVLRTMLIKGVISRRTYFNKKKTICAAPLGLGLPSAKLAMKGASRVKCSSSFLITMVLRLFLGVSKKARSNLRRLVDIKINERSFRYVSLDLLATLLCVCVCMYM